MKARPRHAENRVAEILSEYFVSIGASPVERIPVIGRTGPDLTINEVGLVVDVKSRLEVPKSYLRTWPCYHADLFSFPLLLLDGVLTNGILELEAPRTDGKIAKTVTDYWDHMQSWTLKHRPDGITAIVLHAPKLPFGMAQMVIHQTQLERLQTTCQKLKSLSLLLRTPA